MNNKEILVSSIIGAIIAFMYTLGLYVDMTYSSIEAVLGFLSVGISTTITKYIMRKHENKLTAK